MGDSKYEETSSSASGAQIVTVTDPQTGQPVQQIVQTVIDPATGKPTQVMTPLSNTQNGNLKINNYKIIIISVVISNIISYTFFKILVVVM